eukprot:gnl/MRDRNA2_/MRDRNA2_75529_c0_seq1.p1 gnl/MRDRNA2_/MRDRNA2_75529_c0~~gnl/MRDRNA2_/MRDRNA2_75529_c0_seq1.p1  ORF type:complete len:308 (-),score=45.10 gnl/MRDRNA2_/MRDRNA2_75529_c0_seq1:497-1420(-)
MFATVGTASVVGCLSGCLTEPIYRCLISKKAKRQSVKQVFEEAAAVVEEVSRKAKVGSYALNHSNLVSPASSVDALSATEPQLRRHHVDGSTAQCHASAHKRLQASAEELQRVKCLLQKLQDSTSVLAAQHVSENSFSLSDMASRGVESIYDIDWNVLEVCGMPEESTEATDSDSNGRASHTGNTTPMEMTPDYVTACDAHWSTLPVKQSTPRNHDVTKERSTSQESSIKSTGEHVFGNQNDAHRADDISNVPSRTQEASAESLGEQDDAYSTPDITQHWEAFREHQDQSTEPAYLVRRARIACLRS